jgi:hypothetical protein
MCTGRATSGSGREPGAPLLLIGGAAGWEVNTPTNHLVSSLAPAMAPVAISFNSSGTYLGQAVAPASAVSC